VADGEHALAAVLHERGELDRAEELYRSSLEGYLARWGEEDRGTCLRFACLGELLLEREDPQAAEEMLERALVGAGPASGLGPDRAVVLQALGEARLALDRHEQAVPLLEEALALRRARAAPAPAKLLAVLGGARLELGEARAAVDLLQEAMAASEEQGPERELDPCELQHRLAQACLQLGRSVEAQKCLALAVAERERHVAAGDPGLERLRLELERVRDRNAEPTAREAAFERER
jgi:tetratricopeptide (TPR) repeat protein